MPLAHAILASLEFRPMSGYDLKKFFDQSVGNFWSTTQSHIYKDLEKLEEAALVEAKVIPQEGKPSRREYHITETGRDELHRWLVTPLPLAPVREPWLIQLFFSHTSTDEEITALVEARGKQIQETLDELQAQNQPTVPQNVPPELERAQALWKTTFDFGIAYYEFELRWNQEMLERVKNLPPLK